MTPSKARRRAGPRLDRLVVGIDFTDASIDAARWVAQHFARGAELVLVHVIQPPAVPRFLEKRFPATDEIVATARTGAELRLRELSTSIATGLIWLEVRVGAPDEELVGVAADYDANVIVVGQPAPRPDGWGRIGTTAQRVLRQSPVPVLLVTGDVTRPPSHVLVAVDDSDMADPALRWGALLRERYDARATAVHVVSVPVFAGSSALQDGLSGDRGSRAAPSASQKEAVQDAEHWLREQVGRLPDAASMTTVVAADHIRPADAILDAARRESGTLIVMGSRGGGMAHRFLYGSVAEGVLTAAPCPVLVIVPRRSQPRPSARTPATLQTANRTSQ